MTDVFVSYSRKNIDFVRKIFDALEANGKDVWVDWENIPLTADWLEEIKDGIEAADSFVYVISPDSVHSEVCAVELNHALENKKRLIPIMHVDLIEEHDQAALHPTISSHNWLFFRDEDDFDTAFQSLTNALDADLDHMRAHTRLLVKAKEWTDRDRDSSLLLRGTELAEAEAWLTVAMSKKPEPTEHHTEFIMSSHHASNTRQRTLFVRVLFALGISIILAVVAAFQWQRANVARNDAQTARVQAESLAEISHSLAVASIAQQTNDRILAIALARAASNIDNPPGLVERALADVVYAPGVRNVFDNPDSDAKLNAIAYTPDETQFAVAMDDGTIVIWDIEGADIVQTMVAVEEEDDGSVHSVQFSQDGSQLLSAASDGRVLVWDIATGDIMQTLVHDSSVNEAIFYGDESQVIAVVDDGKAYLWDVETSEQTAIFDEEIDESATAIALSADMRRLAIGFESGQITLWDARDPSAPLLSRRIHDNDVNSLVFSMDSDFLFSASDDESAFKLDAQNLRPITEFVGHTNRVLDVDVSSDGNQLVTSSRDRTVIYWDTSTGNQIERLWAHTNFVNSVRFSQNGRRALSASADSTAMEWDLSPGNILHTYQGHEDWIRTIDLSNDDTMGVSGSDDGMIFVWDIETEAVITSLEGHEDAVRGVRFTPDDSRVVSGSLDGTARVWTIADASFEEYTPHNGSGIQSIDVALDGERAISGADDGTVRIWDISTGEIKLELDDHTATVWDVRFSPDGNFALSASKDGSVKYWNLETGELIYTFEGHGREALSVSFSPDGTKAVSGSRDAEFFYWDLTTGQAIRPPVIAHGSSVRGADYSPVDNARAISSSADLLMFLWNLETGEVIRAFEGHNRVVYSVDFSADGTMALSGSRDKTLMLWRVDDLESLLEWMTENRYLRDLTPDECELYLITDCEAQE
ncbi:MAG: TIR domain-containing protein [Anaerolineae bacterium]|nr:TIR domain-containing protein [Anaerolineae bacterium]MDQ7034909.1 TIR domain-containing protein [Anaerolineae bacterium]